MLVYSTYRTLSMPYCSFLTQVIQSGMLQPAHSSHCDPKPGVLIDKKPASVPPKFSGRQTGMSTQTSASPRILLPQLDSCTASTLQHKNNVRRQGREAL